MDGERWRKIDTIFQLVAAQPPAERAEFLAAQCSSDAALRREVESLLEAHRQPGGILEENVWDVASSVGGGSGRDSPIGETFGHYEFLSHLGSGGMGDVYLARDVRLDRKVAVKVLPDSLDPERLRRFETEARAASALNHPNVVSVFDIGSFRANRFIVTEFVDGQTLRRRIQDKALSVRETIGVAVQVASALAEAHRVGIVHRDIKPENIILRPDGLAKVVDFGLAKLTDQRRQEPAFTDSGHVIGTPHYMSPEQARGRPIDARTDIFSLGVVLYEMLSGLKPFDGDTTSHVIVAILEKTPGSLANLVLHLPAGLAQTVDRALAKDPNLRYVRADDMLGDLQRILRRLESGGEAGPRSDPPRRSDGHSIVGREGQIAALRAACHSAASGRGGVVCVTGEPGIGKTTVVEQFLAELEGQGAYLVARRRVSASLAGTDAYLPLLETLDGLLRTDRTGTVGNLLKSLAPGWYVQLISVRPEEDTAGLPPAPEPVRGSQERLKRELHALLAALSRLRPVVFFLDDLHWADASSVDVLAFLTSRIEKLNVLIVITYRPSEMQLQKHPFLQLKLELQAHGLCREIPLDFLTKEDLDRYLALEFPRHRFPAALSSLVHSRTEGNPLFMVDLVRYLEETDVIGVEGGVWELKRSLPEIGANLPESIRSMIERKTAQLSDRDRKLLEAASIAGHHFRSAVLAKVLSTPAEEIEEHLRALDVVHNFVRLTGEEDLSDHTPSLSYRFVHALYQHTLCSAIQPTRKANLSRVVAEALLELHPGDPSFASRLAHLFLDAREYPRAVVFCLQAAQRAADVFASAESAALARLGLKALSFLPEGPGKIRSELALQLTLGLSLSIASSTDPELRAAMNRAREICQQLGNVPQLAPALFALCGFYFVGGELPLALPLSDQLLRIAEAAADPGLNMGAQYASGTVRSYGGELAEGCPYLERAVGLHDPEKTAFYRSLYGFDPGIYARSDHAIVLWGLGYPDRALRLARTAVDLARSGDPKSRAYALAGLAIVYNLRRQPDESKEWSSTCMAVAEEYDVREMHVWGNLWHAWAAAECGIIQQPSEHLKDAMQGMRAIGARRALHWFLALLGEMFTKEDRIHEAMQTLDEAATCVTETGERFYEAEIHRLKGTLESRRSPDNLQQAEDSFRQAIAIARRQGSKSLELRASVSLSRLWRQQSRPEAAREILTRIYETFTEGFDTPDLLDAATELGRSPRTPTDPSQ